MKYARWCERGKPQGDPLLDCHETANHCQDVVQRYIAHCFVSGAKVLFWPLSFQLQWHALKDRKDRRLYAAFSIVCRADGVCAYEELPVKTLTCSRFPGLYVGVMGSRLGHHHNAGRGSSRKERLRRHFAGWAFRTASPTRSVMALMMLVVPPGAFWRVIDRGNGRSRPA